MTVSIIIPTWNKADLLSDCLDALHATAPTTPVIVVDNGSEDRTDDLVANHEHPAGITYIRIDTNEGFAPACNKGARAATTSHVLFLNNDTIPQPGWLAPMERAAKEHPIVGAHLTYPDGGTQHAGILLTRPGGVLTGVNITQPRPSGPRAAVTGACLLIDRHIFDEVGGFHEGFRNGYEDIDLCLAVRDVWYCADANVVHLESRTPGRFTHAQHNIELLQERWGRRR